MFDAEKIKPFLSGRYYYHNTISVYGKKRGLLVKTERRLEKAGVIVAGMSFFHYSNNPAFELHIKVNLSWVGAN